MVHIIWQPTEASEGKTDGYETSELSDFAVQAFCVVPVHPFQSFPFDLPDGFPRPHEVDDLSFEQADCAFGQGIVVAVPSLRPPSSMASIPRHG